jgi:hypothetical protein
MAIKSIQLLHQHGDAHGMENCFAFLNMLRVKLVSGLITTIIWASAPTDSSSSEA